MLNHVGTADPSTNLEDRISKLKEGMLSRLRRILHGLPTRFHFISFVK